MRILNRYIEAAAGLLFPTRCLVCEKVTEDNALFCGDICREKLHREHIDGPVRVIETDGLALEHAAGAREAEGPISGECIAGICASFNYTGEAVELVRRMKFQRKSYIARHVAQLMANDWEKCGFPQPAVVVHVPSFTRGEDGLTQLLAKTLSENLGLRYRPKLLKKIKDTPKQHMSSLADREKNQKGAYLANVPAAVVGKAVVIVDDVITSGNTVKECAKALKAAGAGDIYVCTLTSAGKRVS